MAKLAFVWTLNCASECMPLVIMVFDIVRSLVNANDTE